MCIRDSSGTGIQELTTIIDRLGEGVTNAIGIGGRDLNAAIGGKMCIRDRGIHRMTDTLMER